MTTITLEKCIKCHNQVIEKTSDFYKSNEWCRDCIELPVAENEKNQSLLLLKEHIKSGLINTIYGKWYFEHEFFIKNGPNAFHLDQEDLNVVAPRLIEGKLAFNLFFDREQYGSLLNKGVLKEIKKKGRVYQLRTVVMDSIDFLSTDLARYYWCDFRKED